MTSVPDRAELVEALRRAMDELCAPELTLARAEILRPRVHRILEALREVEAAAHRDRRSTSPAPRPRPGVMGEG
jgi:hypothetical protein